MNKSLIAVSILAAAAVGGAGLAETPAAPRPWADRQMTRAEALAHAEQAFARMDSDRNGEVTPEELRAVRHDRRADRRERAEARLAQLSPEERAEVERRRAERKAKRQTLRAERRAAAATSEGRGPRAMMFAEGPVTLEKFREHALRRFDRGDADKDGVITADERRARRHGRHHGNHADREPRQD
jgi:hypothetical protein